MSTLDRRTEDLLRTEAPKVLGAVVRRYGRFDLAEDAVQHALLAAATRWPDDGLPDRPRAWLIRVASRALTDAVRSDAARRAREEREHRAVPTDRFHSPPPSPDDPPADDSLVLLFTCAHPALTEPSQVALTLRAVGGLTTEEIANAFLVPSSTLGQRISRAKATIAAASEPFRVPTGADLEQRLPVVLRVVYLIFNEGYVASAGDELVRVDLSGEAIRLARLLRTAFPDDGEVAGLLALLLLTEARRSARVGDDGTAISLRDQDRTRWDAAAIAEGVELVERALTTAPMGPYLLQAAIAALHDQAPSWHDTDWRQIAALYELLERYDPSPMVAVNKAAAVGMAFGPAAGLRLLDQLGEDRPPATSHRIHVVRGHLLEDAGDLPGATAAYQRAAQLTASLPERRYLLERAARTTATGDDRAHRDDREDGDDREGGDREDREEPAWN